MWTIPANGDASIVESYGFLTGIIDSWAGAEQRQRLRATSIEGFEFSILAEDREAALAQSLIYVAHDEIMAVPLWQYGSRLSAAIAIGGKLLPTTDAADCNYHNSSAANGTTEYALVWKDPFTWELFECIATGGTGVTTFDAATRAWAIREALVFPCRRARLAAPPEVRWLSSRVIEGRLKFSAEQV